MLTVILLPSSTSVSSLNRAIAVLLGDGKARPLAKPFGARGLRRKYAANNRDAIQKSRAGDRFFPSGACVYRVWVLLLAAALVMPLLTGGVHVNVPVLHIP
jgi:hypothetical protein